MATASNLHATSSSSSPPPKWDVFLSFYGKDTRTNFVSHLYSALDQAGILTFRDDPALEKGEKITPGLLNAINDSKMFVVILSENYARSAWCLNELVEILSCNNTENQAVPVFYYVDPSDLRHLRGSFGEALDFHKKRHSVDMLDKWKSGLNGIAELSGYHLKKDQNENESKTIQEIVDDVVRKTSRKVLHLEQYLLQIDFAVEELFQKLSMDSNDVRAIGICGMGGIGKTTIAKAFYNKYSDKFEISCFIGFVKEFSLGGGSRIIITTRDVNLLNQLKIEIPEVEIYMVKKLGQIDSLELFSYHAFGKSTVPESLRQLSESFANYAGGLPLALKVLGSSLRGRTHDVKFWKAKLQKLKKFPENGIHKILQLSYDELDDETVKAIFLDIAFFFVGKDIYEAVHIFNSCDFYPEAGIPILVERCLLSIDEDKKFQMHNLIKDMGKELGKSTRLSLRGNAWKDLQNLEGSEKIEGLILNLTMSMDRQISSQIFRRLSNLRLLEIVDASDIKGNFKNSFHELRCIRWSHCPWTCLPSSFCPQKLVALDMTFSKFKILWKGPLPLVNLKTIDVSYSVNLKTTPDFRDLKLVEKLSLRGCESLLKVHPSIGRLTELDHLDLGGCDKLKELDEPIRQATKLDYFLFLFFYYFLFFVSKLDYLCMYRPVKRFPDHIKQLTNLSYLSLSFCHNLKRLPDQLGDMKGLKMLDASYSPIEQLPDSITHLTELEWLELTGCFELEEIPMQVGNLESLRVFNASGTAIRQLPDSFVDLPNLVQLSLGYCVNLTSLPDTMWKLEFLKELDVEHCSKLERLPEMLGMIRGLETLDASSTAIEELPETIILLSKLRMLDLSHCKKLKYLPDTIWYLESLKNLYFDGVDICRISFPDIVKTMELESLTLKCEIRSWLPIILTFSCLNTLTLNDEGQSFSPTEPCSLSKLSNLQTLTLANCTSLGSSFPDLPSSLTGLRIHNHATLLQLPDLSSLKRLKNLYIANCIRLHSLPPLPPLLQKLTVYDCTSLKDLSDFSMLKELVNLSFGRSSTLKPSGLKQISPQVERDFFSSHTADVPKRKVTEYFRYTSRSSTRKPFGLNQGLSQVERDFFSSYIADAPNRKITEWFSYTNKGSTVSFEIPSIAENNFFGVRLLVVFTCKKFDCHYNLRAVITNETEGRKDFYEIPVYCMRGAEVHTLVECIRAERISVRSGDKIEVSFLRVLYSRNGGPEVSHEELNVNMCGADIIQRTPSTPRFSSVSNEYLQLVSGN